MNNPVYSEKKTNIWKQEEMRKKGQTSLYMALGLTLSILIVALLFRFKPQGSFYSPADLGFLSYEKGDYQQAMTYFAQADSNNIPEAAFALGAMHFAGKGTEINIPKALDYYKRSAEAGYAPAQTTLAVLYMESDKVEHDSEKAVLWATEAAMNNDMEAQLMLAGWYESGKLIEQDIGQAIRFYEMAAKNGSADAKIALSIIYKTGKGKTHANIYTAKRWEDSIKKQKDFENIFQNRHPNIKEHP